MFIDTHCHLDDRAFCGRLPGVLARARSAGVTKHLIPGVSPDQWKDAARLGRTTPFIYPAFGLHPMYAGLFSDEVGRVLEKLLPEGVATGEIGLDYTLANVSREVQKAAFRQQLRLSVQLGLPVLLHCRKAFADLLAILKEERVWQVGGTMHAFSGSPEVALQCLQLGLLISIAGAVTYSNAVKPLEVVRQIPVTSLLLETDAPDMAPRPYRGSTNEPAYMVETAKMVAGLKQLSLGEVAMRTTANAEALFRFEERNKRHVPVAQILPE